MPAPSRPENGDVVVKRETRDGIVFYILRTAPGTDQDLLHSEDDLEQALTFVEVRVYARG